VCCSVLQCVAVCCSVLQCVAVCCSVLQIISLFCKRALCNKWYSVKETYNLIDPTDRSHPITRKWALLHPQWAWYSACKCRTSHTNRRVWHTNKPYSTHKELNMTHKLKVLWRAHTLWVILGSLCVESALFVCHTRGFVCGIGHVLWGGYD